MATFPVFQKPTNEPLSGLGTPIAELKPALFDAFVKILNLFDEKDTISINNCEVFQVGSKGTTFFYTDIYDIIKNKKFCLQYVNSKLAMSIMKSIKSNDSIAIYDDTESNCYYLISGRFKFRLPKPAESVETNLPSFDSGKNLSESVLIKDEPVLLNLIKFNENDHIELLVDDKFQINAVHVPNVDNEILYYFKNYENSGISAANAHLILKSYSFLCIPSQEYVITLDEYDSDYWLTTKVKTPFDNVTIDIYEKLNQTIAEGLNLII